MNYPAFEVKRTGNVLVLGRDIRAFLSVVRSLGRASLNVHVGMSPPDDLALKSRYIKESHDIPEYDPASSGWLDTIIALTQRHKFDLIIPTHDESAIPVQIFRDELTKYTKVYSLGERAFEIAFDKIKSSELAESLGIRTPRQATVSIDDLQNGLPGGFSFPIVIKPSSSYLSDDLGTRREVVTATNPAQLNDIVPKLQDWDVALIQEHFAGIGTGVEVLVKDGEIVFAFQHMRVHEPRGGGASSYRKSVSPIDPELYTATESLMRQMSYTGVAMVEYKIDPATGDWIFIEINGRFWGSLPLALCSGADFPRLLYEQIVFGNVYQVPPPPQANVYCRNIKRDLYWAIDNLKDRRSEHPSRFSVPVQTVLAGYFRLLTFREHIDSFARDDPGPAITELGEIASMLVAKALSVIHRSLRSVRPIHTQRRNRVRRLALNASRIMFLCSGNICRSPFAAEYARDILPPSVEIISSGFHEVTCRPPPAQAVQSAREFGVDLTNHRSQRIDKSTVDATDIIFIFEEKHLEAFRRSFPGNRTRVFYLGDLLATSAFEIADPYGGGRERFRTAYLAIAHAIDFLDPRYG